MKYIWYSPQKVNILYILHTSQFQKLTNVFYYIQKHSKGVQKHAKGGATVKDLLDEISVYDMTNFGACIIYVGGNDCSNNTNIDAFVDNYDQLISIIKTSNPSCKIYMCEIAPRGDVDVSEFNGSLDKLLKHWDHQNVYRISNTHGYFLDKNYVPTKRYYSNDGIHLSHSGVKRLLDAMDKSVKIVVDYELCVFSSFKKHKQNGNMITHTGRIWRNNGLSGDGNVRILRQSCTSGYKYETFRICSLILSYKYFLVSHLKFFHFQGG